MEIIKSLAELDRTDLPLAGGKGANLGALIRAGLPVPPGFCICTAGYRQFVETNRLAGEIQAILDAIRMDDPAELEAAAATIGAAFGRGTMAPGLIEVVCQAYDGLGGGATPVAVRSSATAEDLPDLSFAGQQDTYLNIVGAPALLDAVKRCWASLWTARAIAYRNRNAIVQGEVSLAVVVQCMVQSEASGVLFTANPLSGKLDETVIDATFGLGEALVSGQVEPDHYVVDSASGVILSKSLGAKALVVQGLASGGTRAVPVQGVPRQALPDAAIQALTRIGQQSVAHFGCPQDLEWAWADGRLQVVQSRPITSLYPLPAGLGGKGLEIVLSFGVWQGMLDPYTPIGQDMFSHLVAGAARLFGLRPTAGQQRVFLRAGERLFVNLTPLLRYKLGRVFAAGFVEVIDPVSAAILAELLKDERLPAPRRLGVATVLRLLRGLLHLARNVAYNLRHPVRGRERLTGYLERLLADTSQRLEATKDLAGLVETIQDIAVTMPVQVFPRVVGGIAGGQAPLQILLLRSKRVADGPALVMELLRGLPHNVTSEMDLALWAVATAIRGDAEANAHFDSGDIGILVREFRLGLLPAVAQREITGFLARYGVRGIGEIDLGRDRWNDDPTSLFQALKSYLRIDPAASPSAVFQQGADSARRAKDRLVAAFRQTRGGFFKVKLVEMAWKRIREMGGLRETPKFFIIRLFGLYRRELLKRAAPLVAAGVLARGDDLMYLDFSELKALGQGQTRDWSALVAERRARYQRELGRRRIPRLMLSDGTAHYDAPGLAGGDGKAVMQGSPVSAGVVEGPVRVVLEPHGVQMVPGEILVCPATDPAWTPLFLVAGGLVMEVGGMMTHGSVVAREYGIPAVVGVAQATTRLRDGQRIRVDGASGTIMFLETATVRQAVPAGPEE